MQPDIPTKSSIMIGLGETKEEIIEVMDDLLANNVDIMAIYQYLQPSKTFKSPKILSSRRICRTERNRNAKGFSHCEAYRLSVLPTMRMNK